MKLNQKGSGVFNLLIIIGVLIIVVVSIAPSNDKATVEDGTSIEIGDMSEYSKICIDGVVYLKGFETMCPYMNADGTVNTCTVNTVNEEVKKEKSYEETFSDEF